MLVTVDGQAHSLTSSFGPGWRGITFEQPGPLEREYQVDGSDTTSTNDRDVRVLGGILDTPLYRLTVSEAEGRPQLAWSVDPDALERAEALDGYYVLLTSLPVVQADKHALLRQWKQEEQIERRFSAWKGPLQVRPVFVTSNARMAALVLLLHLALMLYCLLEREARRQLAAQGRQQVRNLLAGHVDAVPTGANMLLALQHLFLIIEESEHGREYVMTELLPVQATLWRLLGIRQPVWA